ncbi:hypothetical protein PN498_08765 [Oscillatoria sp. CS-180]|uniref:hypothetical protein n=1 Tax=Oscillatoria sp. CS-180 TaxID=3021720 RepID=UPI0023303E24|nr:hypothetical protein [Oscillatoria sp. CS-180]MDB9526076.1 hypothetical protein [Oscillatoria sp. CS-180]
MSAVVLSGLLGCGRANQVEIEQGDLATYECNDGAVLIVRLNESQAIADLPEQPNISLLPIESEFGEKYTDGVTTLQIQGQVASVEKNGIMQHSSCKATTEPEPQAQNVFATLERDKNLPYAERCEIYAAGSNDPFIVPCHFIQQQGYIYIARADGVAYQLEPTGTQTGIYIDAVGNEAYRQAGLGDQGQIYKLAEETVYVYWNTADNDDSTSAITVTFADDTEAGLASFIPQTAIQVLDAETIAMRIVDEEFEFDGLLELGETGFMGQVDGITVLFDPKASSVTVDSNDATEALYEYSVGPLDLESLAEDTPEGETPEGETSEAATPEEETAEAE